MENNKSTGIIQNVINDISFNGIGNASSLQLVPHIRTPIQPRPIKITNSDPNLDANVSLISYYPDDSWQNTCESWSNYPTLGPLQQIIVTPLSPDPEDPLDYGFDLFNNSDNFNVNFDYI